MHSEVNSHLNFPTWQTENIFTFIFNLPVPFNNFFSFCDGKVCVHSFTENHIHNMSNPLPTILPYNLSENPYVMKKLFIFFKMGRRNMQEIYVSTELQSEG